MFANTLLEKIKTKNSTVVDVELVDSLLVWAGWRKRQIIVTDH